MIFYKNLSSKIDNWPMPNYAPRRSFVVNIQTLKAFAALRHMNQSDLARVAGVSRQAVSLWFKGASSGFTNIQTKHLLAVANALGVSADDLLRPLPLLDDESAMNRETTKLLWDKLYPDIVSLVLAALEEKRDAVSRFVQVYGLYTSAKLFGPSVWREFPRYKKFIKPIRRSELEKLWQFKQIQMKN